MVDEGEFGGALFIGGKMVCGGNFSQIFEHNGIKVFNGQGYKLPDEMEERVEELLATCGTALPEGGVSEWAKFLLTLERLDEGWTEKLTALTEDCPLPIGTPWDIPLEQAGVYFLYRHLPAALDDGDVASKAAFAALSVKLLWSLFVGEGCNSLCELVELARMYSSEIEYSEENLQGVFDWLTK